MIRVVGTLLLAAGAIGLSIVGRSGLSSGELGWPCAYFLLAALLLRFVMPSGEGWSADLSGVRTLRSWELPRFRVRPLFLCSSLLSLAGSLAFFAADILLTSAWVLFLLSIVLLANSLRGQESDVTAEEFDVASRRRTQLRRGEFLALVALAMIAFLSRVLYLTDAPPGLWFDEANVGLRGQELIANPAIRRVFFGEGLEQPALYFNLVGLSQWIFGPTIFALRLPSVIAGSATVVVFWFLLRELFSRRRLVWSGAVLLCFSAWHLNFSRWCANVSWSVLCDSLALLLFIVAYKRNSYRHYLWSGLALGLGLHFYHSSRVFALVMVAAGGILFLFSNRKLGVLCGSFLFGCTVLFVVSPILLFVYQNLAVFQKHTNELSVFGAVPRSEWTAVLLDNARRHFTMFTYRGDAMARHCMSGRAVLEYWTGLFFMVGLFSTLLRIHHRFALLLVVGFGISLLGGILSKPVDLPTSLRTIDSVIFVFSFAAYGVYLLTAPLGVMLPGKGGALAHTAVISLATIAASSLSVIQFYDHMHDNSTWVEFNGPLRGIAEEAAKYDLSQTKVLITPVFANQPALTFLNPALTPHARFTPGLLPFADARFNYLVCLPMSDHENRFTIFYPEARSIPISPYFSPEFVGARCHFVPKSAIEVTLGVSVDWLKGGPDGKVLASDRLSSFALDPSVAIAEGADAFRLHSVAKTNGPPEVRFTVQSKERVELSVNRTPIRVEDSAGSAQFPMGISLVELSGKVIENKTPELSLRMEASRTADQSDPEIALFRDPQIPFAGLLASYYAGRGWRGTPQISQIDPMVDFYFHLHVVPQPNSVIWQGTIRIPRSRKYTFAVRAVDFAKLYIDGTLLLADIDSSPVLEQSSPLQLTAGDHTIVLAYESFSGYAEARLFWNETGALEIIPWTAFTPKDTGISANKIRDDTMKEGATTP